MNDFYDYKDTSGTVTINGETYKVQSCKSVSAMPQPATFQLDPKATSTLYSEQRKWIRRGDLLIDQNTGDYIPVRKLTKEQLDVIFKKDLA